MSEGPAKIDRILRALNHPLRRRILSMLADRPGSASSMAAELGLELGIVSYHLNRVLAADCNAVDLVKMVPKRGSMEKVYRLNADLWVGWECFPVTVDSEAWNEIQTARRDFNERIEVAASESRQRAGRRRRKIYEVFIGVTAEPVTARRR